MRDSIRIPFHNVVRDHRTRKGERLVERKAVTDCCRDFFLFLNDIIFPMYLTKRHSHFCRAKLGDKRIFYSCASTVYYTLIDYNALFARNVSGYFKICKRTRREGLGEK